MENLVALNRRILNLTSFMFGIAFDNKHQTFFACARVSRGTGYTYIIFEDKDFNNVIGKSVEYHNNHIIILKRCHRVYASKKYKKYEI